MSVSGIGGASAASQLLAAVSQPKVDRPNDSDGDAPKAQAAPAPGTGLAVNKTA